MMLEGTIMSLEDEKENLKEKEMVKPKENAPGKVSLLVLAAAGVDHQPLEVVRLNENEMAFIPFTDESEEINLHYCSESEINGYVKCNGENCVLCRIGRKLERKLLLPVYMVSAGAIGVLPVSPSLRPYSLLPQLASVMRAGKPTAMFVRRENSKFFVSTAEVEEGMDDGRTEIARYLEDRSSGKISLSSVYLRIANEELAVIPAISRILQLKGK